MRTYEVYKITNKVTNKIYIGITNQGSGARYRHHWYEARIGEPAPIHKSMAKYGEDNFTLEVIDFAENADGSPNTAHSLNPVPFIYVTENKNAKVENGILADVAPSICQILGIAQPKEMTGKGLINA